MVQLPNILAQGGDESQLIILVILVVLSVIGTVIKKIKERPSQPSPDQHPAQPRPQGQPSAAKPASAQPSPARPAGVFPSRASRQEPAGGPGPQRPPARAAQQLRQAMAEALGLELPQAERPAPRPPVQRPVTPYQRVPAPARQGQVPRRVAPAKADAAPKPARHETVAEHHLRSRLPEQSVTPGEPPQPEPIQAATRAQQPQVIVGVDFSDLQKAREAIVYYEVLAPPKCFRRDADMWEL